MLLEITLKHFGIEVRLVDSSDVLQIKVAIDADARLVFVESIGGIEVEPGGKDRSCLFKNLYPS
jgi:O-acetylhomoserine/O-acetylserine sulfhydrylase-like pyridoxal-dependent enzyme